MKFKIKLIIIFFFCIHSSEAANDVPTVLSIDSFFYYVRNNHPVARQAQLKVEEGKASMLAARGNFDPKLSSSFDDKFYKGTEYYNYLNAGVSIPTWAGIDIKSGYTNAYGDFINPELITPDAGLYQVGVSLPVLQGLLFDQRRNAFRQASVYLKATEEEKRIMLNDLLLEAGNAYWSWYQSYLNWQLYKEVYQVNQQRFNAIKSSAIYGDRPFLDTLEASVQLQERFVNQEQARLEFIKKTFEVSGYLWSDENIPLMLNDNTIPSESSNYQWLDNSSLTIEDILAKHPIINLANYKITSLNYDKRWKQEQLKPVLNVNYNALNYSTTNSDALTYNLNNYKWGFTFAFPVLLRKERGGLQLAKIKLQDAGYERDKKMLLLKNKIEASKQEISILINQVTTYQQTVRGYEQLLYAENTLFETGESSLFLVNTRENNMVNAKLKLVDLKAKQQKAVLMYQYNLGEL